MEDGIMEPDTSNLTPEAQAELEQRYKSMQADYTRKTQELAAMRQEASEMVAELRGMREQASRNPDPPRQPQAASLPEWPEDLAEYGSALDARLNAVVQAEIGKMKQVLAPMAQMLYGYKTERDMRKKVRTMGIEVDDAVLDKARDIMEEIPGITPERAVTLARAEVKPGQEPDKANGKPSTPPENAPKETQSGLPSPMDDTLQALKAEVSSAPPRPGGDVQEVPAQFENEADAYRTALAETEKQLGPIEALVD